MNLFVQFHNLFDGENRANDKRKNVDFYFSSLFKFFLDNFILQEVIYYYVNIFIRTCGYLRNLFYVFFN